jgi:tetratricopeptide (TPR) repeat protein
MAKGQGDGVDPVEDLRRRRILPPGEEQMPAIRAARGEALRAWKRLAKLPFRDQMALVEKDGEMQGWALAELFCHESAEATADHRADEALQLAKVALRIAGLVQEIPSWRCRLEGWACGHLANALRARGDLNEAEEGFRRAEALWMEGAVSHPGPLDSARVLRLEALLRHAQGRLKEGLDLLERASAIAHADKLVVRVQKGAFLGETGRWSDAARELQRASDGLAGHHPPHLRLDAAFNLTVSLLHAGQPAEAKTALAELRNLVTAHGTKVDHVRTLWQEARLKKSLPLYGEVRNALTEHGLPYDAAVATFETAALHAEKSHTSEVQELARGLAPLSVSERVPRQARATIKIFCKMAEKDGLDPERTRRFAEDFLRTAGDPSLRIEPWPLREE